MICKLLDEVKICSNLFTGYPHSTDEQFLPFEESFEHLQDEMRAGADFIISQMVFDAQMFINFVKQCRNIGIQAPIIPGILPIQV